MKRSAAVLDSDDSEEEYEDDEYDQYDEDGEYDEENDDDDDEDEEDDDDDDEGPRGRSSFLRIPIVEPTPVAYASLDDRPMTLLRAVPAARQVDAGAPYFRTTLLPFQRDPLLQAATQPPHAGLTPHGAPVASTLLNLRKAVEMGDAHHTAACLLSLFDLFVAVNRRMRTFAPSTDREIRLELLQQIGPFANRNALAVHQTLWHTVRTIFMDQIGVANCTALVELQRLWREYELFLFCDPYTSLAALLSIGQLLCRCYKDGSVLYAYDCWADTAQDRLWRAEAQRDPRILARAMCGQDRDRAKQVLACENVYYTNRSRHLRYQQMALTHRHLQYILQGKTMKPRMVRAFVDQLREEAEFYMGRNQGEPESLLVYSVIEIIESWCVYEYAKVHCLHGHRESENLQVKMLVFLQLFSECLTHPDARGLGEDGLLATSNARVHSTLNVKVNATYARRCRESVHDTLLLKYGLLSDGSVPILPTRTGKRAKPASAAAAAAGVLGIIDLMHPTPPCVPRTHEHLHPGAEVNADGVVVQNPRAAAAPCNRLVQACFRYLYCMYYAKRNWKRLCRQVKAAERGGGGGGGSSGGGTVPLSLDSTYFDFTRRDRKPCRGLLGEAPHYHMMELFLMHTPPGLEDAYHPCSAKSASAEAEQDGVRVAEFDDPGMAQLFVDALLAESLYGPTAVVLGPFPPSMRKALEARVADTTKAKALLGVAAYSSQVVCLGLNHFPVKHSPPEELFKGHRALFVVHVPHQVQNVCFRISELKAKLEKLGCKHAFARACPARTLLPIVAYMEAYAHRQSNLLPHDSYITFAIDLLTTATKTQVVFRQIRTTVMADDLGLASGGVRFHAAINRKDVPLDEQLAAFERAILKTPGRGVDLHRHMRELRNRLAMSL